jgi:hypothetical protein
MSDHLSTRAVDCDADRVVELRQYALRPRQRDVLVDLFDREFVETQEALGMRVLGQFRDLDDPDRFVWLRGFADMASRPLGLEAFYGGPVWAAHRSAANATMIDSDNVLLLRPAWPGAGVVLRSGDRAPPGSTHLPRGLLEVTVFPLKGPAGQDLLAIARGPMTAVLQANGAEMRGWYSTELSANNFARLPVREGEHVLVSLAMFADADGRQSFAAGGTWQRDIAPELSRFLVDAPRSLKLGPTARSALHA